MTRIKRARPALAIVVVALIAAVAGSALAGSGPEANTAGAAKKAKKALKKSKKALNKANANATLLDELCGPGAAAAGSETCTAPQGPTGPTGPAGIQGPSGPSGRAADISTVDLTGSVSPVLTLLVNGTGAITLTERARILAVARVRVDNNDASNRTPQCSLSAQAATGGSLFSMTGFSRAYSLGPNETDQGSIPGDVTLDPGSYDVLVRCSTSAGDVDVTASNLIVWTGAE